jgi:hypothetical protein
MLASQVWGPELKLFYHQTNNPLKTPKQLPSNPHGCFCTELQKSQKIKELNEAELIQSIAYRNSLIVFRNTLKENCLRPLRMVTRIRKSVCNPLKVTPTHPSQDTCCLWLCTAGFSRVLSCRHQICAGFSTTAPPVSLNITSLKLLTQNAS